jgi:hypothetical protein
MQKNTVLVEWKEEFQIRSDNYTVHYSGSKRAERSVVIVVHKSIMRSVVKKIVCNGRITTLKFNAKMINILSFNCTCQYHVCV